MFKDLSRQNKINYFLILIGAGINFSSLAYIWLLPKFVKSIGGNQFDAGMVLGVSAVTIFFFSPLAGHWADRMSAKRLIIIGVLISICSMAGFLLVKEVSFFMYLLRLFHGIGHSLVFAPLLSILAHMIPAQNKAEGLGYFVFAIQVGNSLGSFLSNQILKLGFNWFFAAASLTAFTAVLIFSFIRLERNFHESLSGQGDKENWLAAVFKKKYIAGYFLIFILGGVFGTVLQFVPAFFDELFYQKTIPAALNPAYFLTPGLLTVAVSRVIFGRFTDRVNKIKLISINFIVMALSVFLITTIHSPLNAVFIGIFFGLSYGVLYPVLNALVLNRVENPNRGKVSGILAMLFDTGFASSAFLAGSLIQSFGFLNLFYFATGLILCSFVFFTWLERKT